MYLCCDLEVFVLLQQLLCVMNAGASGCVCGQVKLPSVMDPLQGLRKQPKKPHDNIHTARPCALGKFHKIYIKSLQEKSNIYIW